jgi:hypothetical protein
VAKVKTYAVDGQFFFGALSTAVGAVEEKNVRPINTLPS